ncbi:hypothetical protein GCM10010406_49910 [Streptomyces thermolineatus]|uniref:Integral membrane protein n=1 Tax=Streptomyces thermolineatus TaxID=44033 RepID=A0ABN3MSY9_9ACTN
MSRLLAGEVRILLRGTPLWWWAGVLVLTLVSLVATPASVVPGVLLPPAWIRPVPIWSRLGTQRHECGVEALLGAYPAPRLRTVAEWAAGFLLTAVAGAGPALRMAAQSDGQGLVHWVCGALFVPSLALLLGTLSRTHRLFQLVCLPLRYGALNGMAPADFMGAVRGPDGRPAGLPPTVLVAGAAVMLAVVLASGAVRRSTRA